MLSCLNKKMVNVTRWQEQVDKRLDNALPKTGSYRWVASEFTSLQGIACAAPRSEFDAYDQSSMCRWRKWSLWDAKPEGEPEVARV